MTNLVTAGAQASAPAASSSALSSPTTASTTQASFVTTTSTGSQGNVLVSPVGGSPSTSSGQSAGGSSVTTRVSLQTEDDTPADVSTEADRGARRYAAADESGRTAQDEAALTGLAIEPLSPDVVISAINVGDIMLKVTDGLADGDAGAGSSMTTWLFDDAEGALTPRPDGNWPDAVRVPREASHLADGSARSMLQDIAFQPSPAQDQSVLAKVFAKFRAQFMI